MKEIFLQADQQMSSEAYLVIFAVAVFVIIFLIMIGNFISLWFQAFVSGTCTL